MEDKDVTTPVVSFGFPVGWRRFAIIPLYILVIMSLLALAELNPWGNDLSNTVDLEEEIEYSSFMDVPWADLKNIHGGTINLEEGIIWTEYSDFDYCERNTPEDKWITVTTKKGTEIDIFVDSDAGLRIPIDSPMCGEAVTEAEVFAIQNENGSFHLLSWSIYDGEPEPKANYEHIRWALIGVVCAYLLLRIQPTELQNRLDSIRRKNTPYTRTTKDEWVFYDSWSLVKDPKQEGELISEHPTKLPMTESGVITPWVFLIGVAFILLHILLREIFILGGTNFGVFMNHDMKFEILAFILAAFIITVAPYVLIGKLFNLKTNLSNTLGIILKKRKFMKLIEDVPTSTIRGLAVGRVEIAGVALNPTEVVEENSTRNQLIVKVDERVFGIQNPDNWPIFRKLSRVRKEDIDPNHEISFLVHDGTGSVMVRMPRKDFVLGAPRAKERSYIFNTKRYWAIDEGDPVLVVGEAMIGDGGEVYVGSDGDNELPSAVFKGTEWTVQSGFRSTLEYMLADVLLIVMFLIFILQYWGVV